MINSFTITDPVRQVQKPFLRITLNGEGCGEKGCNCSPANYISLSDGKNGLTVELTNEQINMLLKNRYLETIY